MQVVDLLAGAENGSSLHDLTQLVYAHFVFCRQLDSFNIVLGQREFLRVLADQDDLFSFGYLVALIDQHPTVLSNAILARNRQVLEQNPIEIDMQTREAGEALLSHQALELEVALHDALVRQDLRTNLCQKLMHLLCYGFPATDAELHDSRLEEAVLDIGPAGCEAGIP